MIHPAYNLNPGDMFQVDPERVLFATGAKKTGIERRLERRISRREAQSSSETLDSTDTPSSSPPQPIEGEEDPSTTPKATLKSLLTQAKTILTNPTSSHSAARKRELRDFQRQIKRTLSNPRALSDTTIADSLSSLASKLSISDSDSSISSSPTPRDRSLTQEPPRPRDAPPRITATLKNHEERMLAAALAEARDNPIDSSKPYATPWRPRPYMSAFAFIPRYLEVHHTVCSAVYLRHPVARAGLAEVPTPFSTDVNGLAFNWYLRRR